MNDYLWDKSGEMDEDVRQLEELLGNLRHQPRPLELPEVLPVANPRRRARTFWPALAAAAALLLVALVGLQRNRLTGRDAATVNPESAATTRQQHTPAKATRMDASASVAAESLTTPERMVEQVAVVAPERRIERRTTTGRAHASKRQQPREASFDEGNASQRYGQQTARLRRARGVSPKQSPEDFAAVSALARERQMAKEQLMLALRLTSAKLNIVQRKTSGTNEVKSAPEEQYKLR